MWDCLVTLLSALSSKLKEKFGSAVQSCSGVRHTRFPFLTLGDVELAQSGSCWLYAMLIAQSWPIPVDLDTDAQVEKTISIVPSLSNIN